MKPFTWGTKSVVAVSAVIMLLVWQIAAILIDASILLPTPLEAFKVLLRYLLTASFWEAVGATAVRALKSFLITLAAGLVLGLAAGLAPRIKAALLPLITIVRTLPVMSVILLALIWFRSGTVPVFAAFLMSFPILFENTFQGVFQTDRRLLEMGDLYGLSPRQKILHISIPSLLPFLLAGARGTIGMTWKVVIAAEVLTVPRHGIGSGMQFSQVNLETGEVMAWTAAAILLSGASQVLFNLLPRLLSRLLPRLLRRHRFAVSGLSQRAPSPEPDGDRSAAGRDS